MSRGTILVFATLLAAGPLAAQAPATETFLPLARYDDGTVVGVDTSTYYKARGDSTWAVERVTRLAATPADSLAHDLESVLQEWSCAHRSVRPIGIQRFREGRLVHAELVDSPEWSPVPESWLPHLHTVCAILQRPPLAGEEAADSVTEEQPVLMNRSDVARSLQRYYPPLMRDRGITGQVLMRFRVLTDGTVDPASIRFVYATHTEFANAAFAVARAMRFSPAKLDGVPVKVWVNLPVYFTLGA